jgi:hypothetical protein
MLQLLIPAPPAPEALGGRLYSDSNDRVVIAYDLGRAEGDKLYFWDGHPLFGIANAEASALANSPGLEQEFARDHGLILLEAMLGGMAKAGNSLLGLRDIGRAPLCRWPYDSLLVIEQKDKAALRIMFFRRRAAPFTAHYAVICEGGPGDVDLTTRFENVVPGIYFDRHDRPLLDFNKPPVVLHFNEKGKNIGPHAVPGLIAAPADLSSHLYILVAEGKMQAKVAVGLIEAELDRLDRQPD